MKNKINNGDILVCRSNGVLGRLIRKITKSDTNHTALALKVNDVLMVIDSQKKGTNPVLFENWLKEYGYKFRIFRYIDNSPEWGKIIRERALLKSGIAGYDFFSLLFFQPMYILTGKWIGKKGEKAEKRLYCSEFVAWVHGFPKWWEMSPKDVLIHIENSNEYYEII